MSNFEIVEIFKNNKLIILYESNQKINNLNNVINDKNQEIRRLQSIIDDYKLDYLNENSRDVANIYASNKLKSKKTDIINIAKDVFNKYDEMWSRSLNLQKGLNQKFGQIGFFTKINII